MNFTRIVRRVVMAPTEAMLGRLKREQLDRFETLSERFESLYLSLTTRDVSRFTTPMWEDANRKLEDVLLPRPARSFLRDPLIAKMMFVDAGGSWMAKQLLLLGRNHDERTLRKLLEEDAVGGPRLISPRLSTSHNNIHHAYHLERYADACDRRVQSFARIVEWGAGYGNLAKLIRRSADPPPTYVCIDTPLFTALQWLYLASVLGEEAVRVADDPSDEIVPGRINLVPITALEGMDLNADLFISTWALSESSKVAQDLVVDRGWFGCQAMLLAYQEKSGDPDFPLPEAGRVGALAEARGAVIQDMSFLPGHHYAFL